MSELKRCPACRGRRQVMKLGFTIKDCETCRGTGYIEDTLSVVGDECDKSSSVVHAVADSFVISEAIASVALDNDLECQTICEEDIIVKDMKAIAEIVVEDVSIVSEIINTKPVIEPRKRLGWPKGKLRGKRKT